MPHDEPDASDPMTLHGVMFETDSDDAMREMAVCFIEEYARDGFGAERLWDLFAGQEYAGPCLAYQTLGGEVIRQLIDEHMKSRGAAARSDVEGVTRSA